MSNGTICCLIRACCPESEQVEEFAKLLHEAGREAVEAGKTVAADHHGEKTRSFIEWNELSEGAREGRRIQARFVLAKVDLVPKGVGAAIVEGYKPFFKEKLR